MELRYTSTALSICLASWVWLGRATGRRASPGLSLAWPWPGPASGQRAPFRRIVVPCGQQLGVGAQGQSFPDVHTVVVHGIDARGFNATVLRADSLGHGWSGNNVLHWLAWQLLPSQPQQTRVDTLDGFDV